MAAGGCLYRIGQRHGDRYGCETTKHLTTTCECGGSFDLGILTIGFWFLVHNFILDSGKLSLGRLPSCIIGNSFKLSNNYTGKSIPC